MIACIAGTCLFLRSRFAELAPSFGGRTANVYLGVSVVLMLWFHHWENLFWPFQVHVYVSVLFSLASLFVLSATAATSARACAGIVAAFALGLLAAASFGPGLGVWAPALLVIVLGRGPAAWKWLRRVDGRASPGFSRGTCRLGRPRIAPDRPPVLDRVPRAVSRVAVLPRVQRAGARNPIT